MVAESMEEADSTDEAEESMQEVGIEGNERH